jgi:hypothetical protein
VHPQLPGQTIAEHPFEADVPPIISEPTKVRGDIGDEKQKVLTTLLAQIAGAGKTTWAQQPLEPHQPYIVWDSYDFLLWPAKRKRTFAPLTGQDGGISNMRGGHRIIGNSQTEPTGGT